MFPVNQRNRSRLPLTSNPSESESFSANYYSEMETSSFYGPPIERGQWDHQISFTSHQANMRPVASPAMAGHGYAPLPHPKKTTYAWSQTWQQRPPMNHNSVPAAGYQVQGGFPSNSSTSMGQPRWSGGFQNQINRPAMPYRPQQCNPAVINAESPQSRRWNFRSSGQSSSGMMTSAKKDISRGQNTSQQQKPQHETSLRVITAVIRGMKHWSQYKDKVPMLFEIFATLDSAITIGDYGAKKFLMRDDKDTVQCLYFENDQPLATLTRGQVYRCVGNYNSQKDTMTCVSVRAASPSEQMSSQETVQESDAEMRKVVLALNEI